MIKISINIINERKCTVCEPHHSIVQWDDSDDQDNPTQPLLEALPQHDTVFGMRPPGEGIYGGIGMLTIPKAKDFMAWGLKKIQEWWHLSKMGRGHSESLSLIKPKHRGRLPDDTKFENMWWQREVKIDGRYHGRFKSQEPFALEAATTYAKKVVNGNMTLLRQFLAGSMKHTVGRAGAWAYVERIFDMLTLGGKDVLTKKLKQLLRPDVGNLSRTGRMFLSYGDGLAAKVNQNVEMVIKVILGFTRKRNLLVPAWADDPTVWKE